MKETPLRGRIGRMKLFILALLFLAALPAAAQTQKKTETQSQTLDLSGVYFKGDEVEVMWEGAWYKANIEDVMKDVMEASTYRVHFKGYWHSRDQVVKPDKIRVVKHASPDPSDLKAGETIEVFRGDHYKPGVFVELKKDKALIRFTEGDKTKEEWVPSYKVTKPQ